MDSHVIRLVAVDMDGTLLTSDKRILPETSQAIAEAVEFGICIVLATGRAVAEIKDYCNALAPVVYGITESGGLIYNFREESVIWRHSFNMSMKEAIVFASMKEDVLLQAMQGGSVFMEKGCLEKLYRYRVDHFSKLFRDSCVFVPDIRKHILRNDTMIEKINFYHTDSEARNRSRKRLVPSGMETAYSEYTSLEISPPGVSKGDAVLRLSELLHIPTEEVAAIGDSDNDLSMLRSVEVPVDRKSVV